MFLADATANTIYVVFSVLGLAGALGVAYTLFRSASEQRLKEVDKQLLASQSLLIQQQETELARERAQRIKEEQTAATFRESLTQRAAVDHLAEIVERNELRRAEEHAAQSMLLKDIIAQLKRQGGGSGGAIG